MIFSCYFIAKKIKDKKHAMTIDEKGHGSEQIFLLKHRRLIFNSSFKTASVEPKPYNRKKAVPPLGSTAYMNSVDLKF